jgi:hypothetical protein
LNLEFAVFGRPGDHCQRLEDGFILADRGSECDMHNRAIIGAPDLATCESYWRSAMTCSTARMRLLADHHWSDTGRMN